MGGKSIEIWWWWREKPDPEQWTMKLAENCLVCVMAQIFKSGEFALFSSTTRINRSIIFLVFYSTKKKARHSSIWSLR